MSMLFPIGIGFLFFTINPAHTRDLYLLGLDEDTILNGPCNSATKRLSPHVF